MKKMIVLLKRKPGMSREAFHAHYENVHAPMAVAHIGHLLAGYRRNYVQSAVSFSDLQHSRTGSGPEASDPAYYDAIGEMLFKDDAAIAEMVRTLSQPEVRKLFHDDEEHFVDRDACCVAVVDVAESQLPEQ